MHPVDLIRGSSMKVSHNLTGVPDKVLSLDEGCQYKSAGQRCNSMFSKEDIIYSYTTKQAVEDGVLVKIDNGMPKEAGIKYPVYVTRIVWDKYLEPPKQEEFSMQSVDGRMWDMLFMFTHMARKTNSSILFFDVVFSMPDEGNWLPNESFADPQNREQRIVKLKAIINAQDVDDPSPAIFIMLPDED